VECHEDAAGERFGGSCGNLYGFLAGSAGASQTPLLFSAHMDTVEPALGKRPFLRGDGRVTSQGSTILGADDNAGIAVLLEALARLKEGNLPHCPVELLFPIAEERYCLGSAEADYSLFRSKEAYVLDLSGEIGEAAHAAPTILSVSVTVEGKAAHAGFAPQDGVHAIAVAAKAIARIPQGESRAGAETASPSVPVTCNLGQISGGEADNIVPARCKVTGEIRSFSHEAAIARWELVKAVFAEEADKAGAVIQAEHKVGITAYETPLDAEVAKRFQRACGENGIPCRIHATMGGSDNNNFALHGIKGLVLACSMHDVHSAREWCRLDELEACTRLVLSLVRADVR
jgi:tripeptide aminopeptidase